MPLMQINEFQTRLEESKEMVEGMLITTNVDIWFRQSSEWCGAVARVPTELHISHEFQPLQDELLGQAAITICWARPFS